MRHQVARGSRQKTILFVHVLCAETPGTTRTVLYRNLCLKIMSSSKDVMLDLNFSVTNTHSLMRHQFARGSRQKNILFVHVLSAETPGKTRTVLYRKLCLNIMLSSKDVMPDPYFSVTNTHYR